MIDTLTAVKFIFTKEHFFSLNFNTQCCQQENVKRKLTLPYLWHPHPGNDMCDCLEHNTTQMRHLTT